jgi:hypothetical protein
MSNTKKVASIAFTAATAVGAVVGFTAPAFASNGTLKISNGGQAFTGRFSASNVTAAATLAVFSPNGAAGPTLSCPTGRAFTSGSISAATAPVGTPTTVGTVAVANFGKGGASKRCNLIGLGPSGNSIISASLLSSANLSLTGTTASGVPQGRITAISAFVSGSHPGQGGITGCKFTVTGSLSASYSNTHHILTVDPSGAHGLTVKSADGSSAAGAGACDGTVKVGDTADFVAPYTVKNPTDLTITDP